MQLAFLIVFVNFQFLPLAVAKDTIPLPLDK